MKGNTRMRMAALILLLPALLAGEEKRPLLGDIAASVDRYRGSAITMVLRLRNVDRVFEKIIFYDRKNHDIVFDYGTREKRRKLRLNMLNIHEGMDYTVTFTVTGANELGEVQAELESFVPVVLDQLEGSSGGVKK